MDQSAAGPKLASKELLLEHINRGWMTDIARFHSRTRQFFVFLKFEAAYVAHVANFQGKYFVGGFHDGSLNDLMLVEVKDQLARRERNELATAGTLHAIEKTVLSAEEIELKRAGGRRGTNMVENYTNYAMQNCVLTPEGVAVFNQSLSRMKSSNYTSVESPDELQALLAAAAIK